MASRTVVALTCIALLCSAAVGLGGDLPKAENAGEEVVQTVIGLVSDQDKDLRAVGLQQVRDDAKGAAATRQFAGLLPRLSPDGQAALLGALADRGDKAARPAVLRMLASREEAVRLAAIRAMGPLGEASDVPLLVPSLAAAAEKAAARESLRRMPGLAVGAAILAELKSSPPGTRTELIQVLAARLALDCVAGILPAAMDADARVRQAAMAALGQLAGPEHIPAMLQGVLRAEAGPEREAAEKAVMFVSNRIADPLKRADPLLAAWAKLDTDQQEALLPTLGRVGGPATLQIVEAAIADSQPKRHEAGLCALWNWPDASVARRLLWLAQSPGSPAHRLAALRALIRVAPLRDQRSDAQRLDLLKKAMTLATRDEERNRVLDRCKAVRTIESLRFVAPSMEQPALAQQACLTVVELAHHRELREPNKAEFDRALDAVLRISRDEDVLDRAQRYKKGQTRDMSRVPKAKAVP
ncbi:MAG: HEAT repeat domain-containing protein [Thermoguttaceae bacterium]